MGDKRDRMRCVGGGGVIKVTSQGTKCEYVAFSALPDPKQMVQRKLPGRVGDRGRGRDVQVQDRWFLFFS